MVRQVDPAVRATLVARLGDQQAAGMAISADVRRAAAALAIAESTVWRWLSVSGDSSRSRRGYELTEADVERGDIDCADFLSVALAGLGVGGGRGQGVVMSIHGVFFLVGFVFSERFGLV